MAPFEEGGAAQPSCEVKPDANGEDGRAVCKPTAVSTFMLPTGALLYWNGIESSENVQTASGMELSTQSRDAQSRVLDLSSGAPEWAIPVNPDGGGVNPNIKPGQTSDECLVQNPAGVLGVPGRSGDGFVGSLAGAAGIPEQEPSCSPDDVQDNDVDMFCGDVSMLPDGRPLVIGGTDWYNEVAILDRAEGDPADVGILELEGLRTARTYDVETNTWQNAGAMKYGRWYPGTVTLGDGQILAVGGTRKLIKSTQASQNRRSETYNPATDTWTENFTGPASENTLPQNARLFVTPNGKVFYTASGQMWGPFGQAIDQALFGVQQFFDPQTKEWQPVGAIVPKSSPAEVVLPMQAPYDEMRVLSAGGTLGPPPGGVVAVPLTDIYTVRGDTVTTERTGMLNNPRWFSSAVAMPDGKVMVTGGAANDEVIFPGSERPVRMAEVYDPATGQWTEVGETTRDRTYHNSAVLLPDGRVLIGGHSPIPLGYGAHRDGMPGMTANNDKDSSFEIYEPAYLFNGERPRIDNVQSGIAWGEQFRIETQDAADIEKVMLMRLPSPQHVYDSDARTLELPFTQNGDGSITATAPPNGNIAVPGAYYLFIDRVGDDGENLVPSVARMVMVGAESNSAPAAEPMSGGDITGNGAPDVREHTYEEDPARVPVEGFPQMPGADGAPGEGNTYEILPGGGLGGSLGAGDEQSGDAGGEQNPVPALPEGVIPGAAPSASGRRSGCRRGSTAALR